MTLFARLGACVVLCILMPGAAQQSISPATPSLQTTPPAPLSSSGPVLTRRPPAAPGSGGGQVQLDVLVIDGMGRPVAGLRQQDFTLLDNKHPRPILSFQAVGDALSATAKTEPPAEVILLIDTANISLQRVACEKFQLERYLRSSGGHLLQPVTLMLLNDQGVRTQAQPSSDGNAVAKALDQSDTSIHTIQRSSGAYGAMERTDLSVNGLRLIAAAEARKPGRKLLLWIGPGWPMLAGPGFQYSSRDRQHFFNTIVELSAALREARIALYSVHPLDPATGDGLFANLYQDYLKPAVSAKLADPGNFALPVLAVQSGGRVLESGSDAASLIANCVAEAKVYYRLSFAAASADQVDEYHAIEIHLAPPNLKARTNAGYYAEPAPK